MKKFSLTNTICFLAVFITIATSCPLSISATTPEVNDILSVAEGIINWKKTDNGSSPDGFLINNKYLELAGSTPGDWYQIGMSRLEMNDDYASYLAVIKQQVEKRYSEKGKLSASKSTEWHRISLAVIACGGSPDSFGTDGNGNSINLIADGTYNRGKTISLGKQGINGWIWGLIALDSMKYEVPEDAYYTRDDIIAEILKKQLDDGGFALSGKVADPDITAMALQALAPYYSRENIKTAVDRALNTLSELQLETGDYKSWGTQNVESTCQVMIALCCLGIDPLNDNRFIKNGNTLFDGIMLYRMPDGGFVHSYIYDKDNPTSKPDKSNTMAGEQTLLALAALWRLKTGRTSLYDFSDMLISDTEAFDESDMALVDALPEKLTTADYVTVIKLLDKLEKSGDFANKDFYRNKLLSAKKQIESIQQKIDNINSTIQSSISPSQSETSSSKDNTVYTSEESKTDNILESVISEYNELSEYDREKVIGYEDVLKEKTKRQTQSRAIIIAGICIPIFTVLIFFMIFSIRRRITRKKREMELLEKLYEDEE